MKTPPESPQEDGDAGKMASTEHFVIDESVLAEEKKMKEQARRDEGEERKKSRQDWSSAGKSQQQGQFNKLMHLVEQSKVFATIMQQRMEQEEAKYQARSEADKKKEARRGAQAEKAAVQSQRKSARTNNGNVKKEGDDSQSEDELAAEPKPSPQKQRSMRGHPGTTTMATRKKDNSGQGSLRGWLKKESSNIESKAGGGTVAEALAEEASKTDGVASSTIGRQDLRPADQPEAVVGGIMRSYQLEGLAWLRSLYENGLNGILADEMGLGKTLQTISFLAFLREMQSYGPFLIVAPLSTLGNWIDEFARWAPSIKAVLYHGNPQERADIRSKRLKKPGTADFPVVCTSYEICMNDRKFLSHYGWKFIIIDEGHRLKNLNCRLMKELKQYHSANRLLITGTPLQNNLAELWSLLNFLMPEVFDTLENFESFFDFSAVLQKGGHKAIIEEEQKNNLVASLHAILKPFLLRRVKTDVENQLPPKREYVIYAPLSAEQLELYRAIVEGNGREHLQKTAVAKITENLDKSGTTSSRSSSRKRKAITDSGMLTPVSAKSVKSSRESTPASSAAKGRRRSTRGKDTAGSYKEISDREFFRRAEEEEEESTAESGSDDEEEEDTEMAERAKTIEIAKREVASKKMANPLMQLRLTCNSPHNFYWPFSDASPPDLTLISASGKMGVLDQLAGHLLAGEHKILIFSQFKTQLDLLEDWAELRGHDYCRIDGGVSWAERAPLIRRFNEDASVRLFFLSTRAGGQGINLAAADTVILFDSDWNPQQDLQAQDRAHRIGQTRPVIVYRIATRNTIEQTLLEKAEGKRRLEKLVIARGKFKSHRGGWAGVASGEDYNELMAALEREDAEGYDAVESTSPSRSRSKTKGSTFLSRADLDRLTDRSDAAYARASRGEDHGTAFKAVEMNRNEGVLAGVTRKSGQ